MNAESATDTDTDIEDDQSSGDTEQNAATESDQSQREPVNPLALSDDEIMGMSGPDDMPDATKSSADTSTTGDDADDSSESEKKESDGSQTFDDDEQTGDKTETKTETDSEPESASEKTPEQIASEYDQLFQPMKAGGQTIQLRSMDEAIGLIKKGMDYHRKTEELSAHRKTIKTLEKAGIDDSNLNYLIDLHNKNPQAIARLVADANIDPLDLDADSDDVKQYSPKQYSVSDHEVALDDVLAELKSTDTYGDLISVVGEKWDQDSRGVVANDPALLRVINDHMADGIYPIIAEEISRQRTLGHLQGVNDLTAYQQVGKAINDQGGFNHLITDQRKAELAQRSGLAPITSIPIRPQQGSSDPNLDAKRRAAGSTKASSSPSKKTSNPVNPMALSDEEFEKKFSASL